MTNFNMECLGNNAIIKSNYGHMTCNQSLFHFVLIDFSMVSLGQIVTKLWPNPIVFT